MFDKLLDEFDTLMADRKLMFQVGFALTIFSIFDLARFEMTDEIQFGVRTIGFLASAIAFLIGGEIENSAYRGVRLRYLVVGFGLIISLGCGVLARFYS